MCIYIVLKNLKKYNHISITRSKVKTNENWCHNVNRNILFQLKVQEAMKKKDKLAREQEEVSNLIFSKNFFCMFIFFYIDASSLKPNIKNAYADFLSSLITFLRLNYTLR